MNLVKQRRIFVATEETIHTCKESLLTPSKPLKNHTKKVEKKMCLTGFNA